MKISLMDRSLYYKGLLLLIRKDHEIHAREKQMTLAIGDKLGFDTKFCEEGIAEILENNCIVDQPPVFSSPEIARCFVRDGLSLSAADGEVHAEEVSWLRSVACKNGLADFWDEEQANVSPDPDGFAEHRLELNRFEWE